MAGDQHQDRALRWAREDGQAGVIVRALVNCPDGELGPFADARWFALSSELEDLAAGIREGHPIRRRDLRRARRRCGFDAARVEWGAVAAALLADAGAPTV